MTVEHVAGVPVRPRAVSTARVAGRREIRRRLDRELTPERCAELDELLVTDPGLGVAPLVWLNAGATSASSDAAKAEVAKLTYLKARGADRLDLRAIPPERLRQLATVARRSTPRALRQMDPEVVIRFCSPRSPQRTRRSSTRRSACLT